MKPLLQFAAGLLLSACLVLPSRADVVVSGTRVVYPGQAREVTVQLTNNGATPSLVQAWLDGGNPKVSPDKSDAPFVLTPPIFRIDPHKGQTLRLMYTGSPLPQDRESVFWLNVLEVPPAPGSEAGKNYLQLAFRSRLKVFFRPPKLPGRANDAPDKLRWRVVPAPDGRGYALECDNPTPYHVSFSRIGLSAGGRDYRYGRGGMVDPLAKAVFPLDGLTTVPASGARVEFTSINDYGADVPHEVAPAP
jgi:chaperone protein EcpD